MTLWPSSAPAQPRERKAMAEAFYFGCRNDDAGHFYWMPGSSGLRRAPYGKAAENLNPWGMGIDSKTMYPDHQGEGEAVLEHRDGWTRLGFADRSVDSRGGSHSQFIFRGVLDFDAALSLARETFPYVFERFDFEIVEAPDA